LPARSARVAHATWAEVEFGGDGERPGIYGAYRKVVDVPSEDVMVTGQAIAADRDDRWLGVTLATFTRNGLITDATRTIAEQDSLNSSTSLVAQRVSEGAVGALAHAHSVAGRVQ
jgi:hypothetical protein